MITSNQILFIKLHIKLKFTYKIDIYSLYLIQYLI